MNGMLLIFKILHCDSVWLEMVMTFWWIDMVKYFTFFVDKSVQTYLKLKNTSNIICKKGLFA